VKKNETDSGDDGVMSRETETAAEREFDAVRYASEIATLVEQRDAALFDVGRLRAERDSLARALGRLTEQLQGYVPGAGPHGEPTTPSSTVDLCRKVHTPSVHAAR
jgi:hypothetical protein